MLNGLILMARVALSLVFLVAGAAKLADRRGAQRALEDFGAPAQAAPAFAIALPLLELIVGLGLLSKTTALPSAVGACALLLLFTAAIGIALALGRTPQCHCFGQLHSEPAGLSTLIRNGVLAAAAGALAWVARGHPGAGIPGVLAALEASHGLMLGLVLVLIAAVAAQSVLLFQLIRQQGRLLLQLEGQGAGEVHAPAKAREIAPPRPQQTIGVPVGSEAPAFELATLDGGSASLGELRASYGALLLIFANPKCGPCSALAPEIAHWGMDESLPAKIVLISEGEVQENVVKYGTRSDPMVLLQAKREVADAYKAAGTPAAVLIGRDGRMASLVAFGADAIRQLVEDSPALLRSLGEAPRPVGVLPEGQRKTAASHLALQDGDGAVVPLDRFAGASTLLLFWNPACGFCQRMEPDLVAWLADPPQGAPEVTVVLTSPNAAPPAALGRARTMVDADGAVGSAFGARGTPMGVLLDAKTRVASETAAGAKAVFELLSSASRELAG